jgi:hypothetical protein
MMTLLGFDATLAALMSLIATTVNAYWVPYLREPLASTIVIWPAAPTGAVTRR